MQRYHVYILTNEHNHVLYTGVTNDLKRRVSDHKRRSRTGFTRMYNATKLVYYEVFSLPETAIMREKQLKGGSRKKKVDLINSRNPEWQDLYDTITA